MNASSLIVGVFSASPGCVRLSIQCFRKRRNQISIRAMELRNATDKEVVARVGGSEKEAVERVKGSPLSISLTLVTSLRPDRSYSFLASIQLLTICGGKNVKFASFILVSRNQLNRTATRTQSWRRLIWMNLLPLRRGK